ncbi:hypothetical protein ABZ484_23345 [Streptomyces sp. NPDC006393]|uniref:hypothetical protein n=1 Tax=Streptomyces sp. NPDC006393 TaxID=3156763 RepID=UPI0033C290DE
MARAGFYREIGGQATTAHDAPALRDAVQSSGPWDEDRILAYLESANRVGNHPELADSKPTAYGPLDVFHRP